MRGVTGLVLLDFLFLSSHGLVRLRQVVAELLVGRLGEHSLLPQVWSQVGIGLGDGSVGGLGKVAESTGGATSRGVAIFNTSHLQELLGDGGRDDASTARSRDQTHPNGTALASDLARNGVGLADLVTPETPPDGEDRELGQDDGATDSSCHLLGALDTKTNVTIVITDGDEGLKPGTLTGTSLLLDGHDLQNFVLQLWSQERVDNLGLFDGKREEVDLLQSPDLLVLDETAQFGDWDPFALLLATATASAATTTASAAITTTSASATAAATTVAKSTTETSTIGWC